MNWSVPLMAFFLSAMVAAWLDARMKSKWTARRRVLGAALPLPLLLLVLGGCGIAWELFRPRTGENMMDLAVAAVAAVAGLLAVFAFVGGLLGASLVERSRGK